jgi:hypothetical protein
VTERRARFLPAWLPNPIDGGILFLLEAMIVFALAAASFGVAALALWIF